MRNFDARFATIIVALFVGGIVITFQAPTVRTQSPLPAYKTKPETRTVDPNDDTAKRFSAFAGAASRNQDLQTELTWTFGGKQQRGWYLYDLLIRRTINTEAEPESVQFAAALATWQKRMGITSNGVLDENTLMAMIGYWQGNRLKDRSPAQQEQLVLSPS